METDRGRQIQTSIAEAIPALVRLILYFGGMSLGMVFIAAVTDFINARTPRAVMCAILVILFCLGYWMTMTTLNGLVRSGSAHYVLMICGSGGHTAEMIGMIERSIRPEDSSHRRWAVGIGDEMSFGKVMAFERRLMQRFSHLELDSGTFDIVWFERARVVHQSWLTTPFTAVLSMIGIFRILITPAHRRPASAFRFPGVIVTNGPGTGFLFLLAARVLKTFHVVPKSHMKTIFVESWARIKTLSLTGKLIHRCKLADVFIVQSRGLTAYGIFAENMPAMPVVPQFALDQQ
ncbi:Uu.00g068720.m01.CDS01 [Anthostomella pinea]|uniref:UDP-N-acetylglucosamine transferase subunit ALG14 n=1 Tax=Anthostomella pinea TaxID=933095 RepID=A0AAI8VUD3_9PEZI|nr:Uu.00g068720.m01.CDS01 [Anthostomella pinea]